MFKIQPAPIPDHITEDGQTLSKRPYPIVVDENGYTPDGAALDISMVVGFVRDLSKQEIDVWWDEVEIRDKTSPTYPVGMYVVVKNRVGAWATLSTAIETFEEI